MKTKFLLSAAAAACICLGTASAQIIVGNFNIPPATAGNMTTFSNLDTNSLAWRVNFGTGIGAIVDAGGGDGYVQLARNFSNSQRVVLGAWIDVAAAGLLPNTNYQLQFDYTVDRVGSRAYDATAAIRYGVAATGNTYNQVNGSTNWPGDFSLQNAGNILINYSNVSAIATPGHVAWTTYTSALTFSFAPGTDKLAILIQGQGYGVGNNNWPADGSYTFLGIDNIAIVPEPATWALVALGGTFFVLFRRRRKI